MTEFCPKHLRETHSWFPPLLADVYFKDVSAPLESIYYLGPHAWYTKDNEIKQSKTKSTIKRKKEMAVSFISCPVFIIDM